MWKALKRGGITPTCLCEAVLLALYGCPLERVSPPKWILEAPRYSQMEVCRASEDFFALVLSWSMDLLRLTSLLVSCLIPRVCLQAAAEQEAGVKAGEIAPLSRASWVEAKGNNASTQSEAATLAWTSSSSSDDDGDERI